MRRFADPAAAILVTAGETFAIALPGNPSTGYTWQASVDPRYLELIGQEFEPDGEGVGSGGYEVLRLRALIAGETEVTCDYQRPWDREARNTTRFRVVIR
jgi:predicted secreted protein